SRCMTRSQPGCQQQEYFYLTRLLLSVATIEGVNMALETPNLKIKTVSINELKSSEYNPRKWSESATEQLAESIRRFGLVDPILCNQAPGRENVIIGGHFRLKVAKELGYTEVPVAYVNIPDLAKEKELNIRLN